MNLNVLYKLKTTLITRCKMSTQLSGKYGWLSTIKVIIPFLLFCNIYAQEPSLYWCGTLGGSKSEAYAVSADGKVVVGTARNAEENPRAFRWTAADGIEDLGTLGGNWSEATDVSADGSVIVGWSYDGNEIYRAFKWTRSGGMQDIGGGDYSRASGVSADGSVILINVNQHAFRWTLAGGLDSLGTLGGNWSDASDISADGLVIVGSSYDSSGDPYAFRWTPDTSGMEQIGTYYSFAAGVSADGSTVTGFETASAGFYRAFSWSLESGFTFNIAGNFSQGSAVSGDGSIIVGDNGNGAFRLSDSLGLEALNQVYAGLLTDGSDLYTALDISPDGTFIVGIGTNNGTERDEGYLLAINGLTSSIYESEHKPVSFLLYQNYPNPFNPSTTIRYDIVDKSRVKLTVYNVLGQEVVTLIDKEQNPGHYTVEWNAGQYPSGVYFYVLQNEYFTKTRKLILIK
jgi:probable HAF family extracellular repeat protein